MSAKPEEIPAAKAPADTDEAYKQYLRNADLLCRQLSALDDQKDGIIKEAQTEADGILKGAQTEADGILKDANEQAEGILADAGSKAEQIIADADQEAEAIAREAKELASKKDDIIRSLTEISDEVRQVVEKVR